MTKRYRAIAWDAKIRRETERQRRSIERQSLSLWSEPVKFSVKVNKNKRSVKDDSLRSVDPVPLEEDLRADKNPLYTSVTSVLYNGAHVVLTVVRCKDPFTTFNTNVTAFNTQKLQRFTHKSYNDVSYSRATVSHTTKETAFHTQELQCFIHTRKQRLILKSYSVSYTKETAFYTQKLQRLTHKCYAFP